MTCPICQRWSRADPETGYDADDICPDCRDEGYYLDRQGHIQIDGMEDLDDDQAF